MTIVRNITSHSENAVEVEARLFSYSLASDASSSAFLLELLRSGAGMESAAGLIGAAESFIVRASYVAQGKGSTGKQSFKNLIPFRAAVQVVADTDQLISVSQSLGRVLNDYRTSGQSDENIDDLIAQLDVFADLFSAQSSNVAKAAKTSH